MAYKLPLSVLVVIHTRALEVLLIERADRPGSWQSVTGSLDEGETCRQTALREVAEETGIDAGRYRLEDWRIQNRFTGKMIGRPDHKPVKSLADMKGEHIGMQVGTGVHGVFLRLIEQLGLKPTDFKISNVRVVDMPTTTTRPSM